MEGKYETMRLILILAISKFVTSQNLTSLYESSSESTPMHNATAQTSPNRSEVYPSESTITSSLSPVPDDISESSTESLPEPIIAATLQRCPNFKDYRTRSSNDIILDIPGTHTNSDEAVDFRIDQHSQPLQCKRTVLRAVKWEKGKLLKKANSTHRGVRLRGSGKSTSHFTHEGFFHGGGHYFSPKDYCVKSVSDYEIQVNTCEIQCSDKEKICIPKCCGVDEILDYWKFTCRKIKKNEGKWLPKLHNPNYPHEKIDEKELERVHVKRQHLDCDGFEKWPLTDAKRAKIMNEADPGITWKLLPNQRPVFLADHRQWVHIPEGLYCVDGFANFGYGGNGTYSGNVDEHSVLLLCPTTYNFPQFTEWKAWCYAIALIFASMFLLFTALIHFLLLDKQHLHGLTVLCHSLSMYFLYIFCAIAHIVSIFPVLKGKHPRSGFCMAVAVLSHYFFMTTFTWLTVMNFDLWLTFRSMRPVSKMSKRIRRFRIYFLIGWGLPAILSVAFYVIDEMFRNKMSGVTVPDYADKSCFVAIWSRGYYMYSLVAIALSINTILVMSTFYIFYEFRKQSANTFTNRKTKSDKYSVRLFMKLFCVMGVAWFVELLSWWYNGDVKPWPVVVLDCVMFLQSFPIFFIFCINRRTLKQLEEKFPSLRRYIRPLQSYKWFRMNSDAEGVEMTTPGSTPRKLCYSVTMTSHSKLDSTLPRKASGSSILSNKKSSSPKRPTEGIMEEVNLDSEGESGIGENQNGVQQAPDLLTNTRDAKA